MTEEGRGRERVLKERPIWLLPLVLLACAPADPLPQLERELDRYPEYSILLEDMREQGNFTTDYYHQYKVVTGERENGSEDLVYHDNILDWRRVSSSTYKKYQPYLGMTLASKSEDGKVEEVPQPPGYRYVGNERYGRWRRDSSGSFWEFYGKYALFSHIFGGFSRPVYRSDWDAYRTTRSRGQSYFGPQKEYGTNGTHTQKTHRNFYQRQQARQAAKQQRFASKARSRMSSSRSRSGGSRGGK